MVQGQSRATAVLRNIQHLLRMNSDLVDRQSERREQIEDKSATLKWKKFV